MDHGTRPDGPGGGRRVRGARAPRDGAEADEAAGDDIIDRLERLTGLWKREILTDAEFVEQKTRLLSD